MAIASQPIELTVLSSNATRAVLEALTPQFEQTSNLRIIFRFAPSAELKARIEEGEDFDVVILTSSLVDDLVALGKVDPSSRATIARAGVGVAIRKGAGVPDLSTPEAFRRSLLDARSIAVVGRGVTADILRGVIERFGIAEEMRPKTRILSGVTAAEAVASGQAELGFTQVSEILPHPGVELAGPLPPEIQVYTTFQAVVGSNARQPEAAHPRDLRTDGALALGDPVGRVDHRPVPDRGAGCRGAGDPVVIGMTFRNEFLMAG